MVLLEQTTYIAIGVISPVFGDVAVVFTDDAFLSVDTVVFPDDVLLSDAEAFPSSVFESLLSGSFGSVFVTT